MKSEETIKNFICNMIDGFKSDNEEDYFDLGLISVNLYEANKVLKHSKLEEITQEQLNKIKQDLRKGEIKC